jgi:hypothetical protein
VVQALYSLVHESDAEAYHAAHATHAAAAAATTTAFLKWHVTFP